MLRLFFGLLLNTFCLCLFTSTAIAATAITPLNMDLPPLAENQEILMLQLQIAPGEASAPHRHNAHTYVYVLNGTMIMQVDGAEAVTLHAGDTFYENPDNIHLRSENPSTTDSASILVFMIKTKGPPTSVQVTP